MTELCTFDPVRLAEPSLGAVSVAGVGEVRYGRLNMADYMAVRSMPGASEEDAYRQGMEMVYRMLVKAYPDLTRDHMLAWPPQALMDVTQALMALEDFRAPTPGSGSG